METPRGKGRNSPPNNHNDHSELRDCGHGTLNSDRTRIEERRVVNAVNLNTGRKPFQKVEMYIGEWFQNN